VWCISQCVSPNVAAPEFFDAFSPSGTRYAGLQADEQATDAELLDDTEVTVPYTVYTEKDGKVWELYLETLFDQRPRSCAGC